MEKKANKNIGMIAAVVLVIILLLYWLFTTIDFSAYFPDTL